MYRVISYGGGVQSTALLVLAAMGLIDYKIFLFCNVGYDSEHPDTLDYVHNVAMPYAKAHGLQLIELEKKLKDGTPDTIFQRLTRSGSTSIGIPVRMNKSGAPGRRSCTADFKIAVVDKYLKDTIPLIRKRLQVESGIARILTRQRELDLVSYSADEIHDLARFRNIIVQVGLGISLDEITRMKPNVDPDTMWWKENVFPLIMELPKAMTRQDCLNLIEKAGLPIPPKSACVFCPFHTNRRWQEMRQNEPDFFWQCVMLERFINEKRAERGSDPVWFSSKLKPLDEATSEYDQGSLFDEIEDICESGYCFV